MHSNDLAMAAAIREVESILRPSPGHNLHKGCEIHDSELLGTLMRSGMGCTLAAPLAFQVH